MTGLIGRMREATLLTRAGKLGEATSFIQRLLNGDDAPPTEGRAHDHGGLVIDHLEETPARPRAPGRFVDGAHADAAGSRPYKLFIPGEPAGRAPLVVMLHGCTQGPDDFAAGTRMNELAEQHGFFVLYPAQTSAANPQRCWNWFNDADQHRGAGEPAIVAGMTSAIVAEHAIDPRRVFVAGLSAGGAAAAILGEAYPDVFAAIGVHSGLASGSAHGISSAMTAMRRGRAGRSFEAGPAPIVPTIIFHGTRDSTVNPLNADEIVAQARAVSPLEATSEAGEQGGRAFVRTVFADASGRTLVEQWMVEGLGHAWSGGGAAGSYADPLGPDASAEFFRFFVQAAG
jgi:poly(hydroxyalkanoate) depolymerase family esterase